MKNKKKKNINKLVYKRLRLLATVISSLSAGTDENWKGAPRSFSWLLTACLQDLQLLDSFFGNSNTVTVSQVVGRPSYDKRMSSLPFSILVFSLNSTNLLKGCWHGVWLWWTIFPIACAAGGIVVPGVLFWRRSRHVKRVATVVATPTTPNLHAISSPKNYSTCPLIPPATKIFLSFERPSSLMKWWYYVKVV